MQDYSVKKLSFFYVIFFLISTINLTLNEAAKFIQNNQALTCLDVKLPPSTTSCIPVTLNPCPIDRFSKFSESLKWNLIPMNPPNASELIISSSDNQLCLSTASNNVEACPCDGGIAQRWISKDDKFLSNAKVGQCLGLVGGEVSFESCQAGDNQMSWRTYHVSPNAVNLYLKTEFAGKPIQLFGKTYDSKSLPAEIFSSPFSVEIPPGFELNIDSGNNNFKRIDSDNSQMPPINLLASNINVRLKPGMIIYELPAYFGTSKFMEVGLQTPPFAAIGSVLVPEGFRGVIWSDSNFTGDNLSLFEPIANFTGVSVATKQQQPVASLDISATTCKDECGSGGYCSDGGICNCKPGFTGDKCEKCLPRFFGPNCQECKCTGNRNDCDDGLIGTGVCKCNLGFAGENCDKCASGFIGSNCTECNCGSGTCNEQGGCSCNAGFFKNPTTNQCTECKKGFYKSDNDCKSCPQGCDLCDENGKCTQCVRGEVSRDDGKCVLKSTCRSKEFLNAKNQCEPCDPACETCFGPGNGECLRCSPPNLYLEGSCVQLKENGKCNSAQSTLAFFADTKQGICEACPSSCLDCLIPDFTNSSPVENMRCTRCVPGFFFDVGKCVKQCPEGKYPDNIDSTCKACNSNCASCKGEKDCTKCSNKDFFVMNGECSSTKCPSDFAEKDKTCTKCHKDCLECSGPEINQCTKCPPNRPILKDGQCVEVCSKGTYADESGICQKCNADCSSCVGPRADQCLGCSDQSKVLIGGTCSGSCPIGSKLNKFERLCQRLDNDEFLPPGEARQSFNILKQFEWWHILLIIIGSILFLIMVVLLIRYCAVKRRQKKTKKFGDQIDDNTVAQNLKNMLRNSRLPPQPEMTFGSTEDPINSVPPAYDPRDGELYWEKKQQRRQKHMSINHDDYSKWKNSNNNNNKSWEGFDIVTEASSSSSNNVGTNGYNNNGYNNYQGDINPSRSGNGYRNSLRSNRSISVKRSYNFPTNKGESWGENFI